MKKLDTELHPHGPLLVREGGRRLGRRMSRAAMAAAGLALLLVGIVLNVVLHLGQRERLVESAEVQARLTGDALVPALVFEDRQMASDILAALHHVPEVVTATLVDAHGDALVTHRRPGEDAGLSLPPALRNAGSGHLMDQGRLWRRQVLTHQGRPVGALHMAVSLAPLQQRTLLFAGITSVACGVALALAYGFVMGVRRDVDQTEAQLDRLAFVDAVTGLYNRHAAGLHLESLVRRAREGGQGFHLLLLDLDDFKLINDTLGHEAGDQVLRQLAERLRHGLSRETLVFRFGGDEFVIVFGLGDTPEDAHLHGHDVVALLQAPLQLAAGPTYLRGSVGVAGFPRDGDSVEALLRAADAAMYQAKAAGKNLYVAYRAEMGESLRLRVRIDGELRRALERDELRLHYQPVVDLASGAIRGAEALLRWQHPERGLLLPGAFIAVAEASDLIVELGGWVIDEAARQLALWQQQGLHLYVAVNVSALQVTRGVLTRQVLQALQRHGVAGRSMEVEITESVLLTDVEANVATLQALRAQGVRLAVDDFGTGQSSLSYLKRLPVDKFKIDRCFVRDLADSRIDHAIVTAVIAMARAMDLAVVAEGVELEDQREALLRLGCDAAQGFLFSRAVPADEFVALLRAPARARVALPA